MKQKDGFDLKSPLQLVERYDTAYLEANQMLPKNQKKFVAEQGHFLKRPGKVEIEWKKKKKKLDVSIFAQAQHFFSTEVDLI